jgi:hypothetical protein
VEAGVAGRCRLHLAAQGAVPDDQRVRVGRPGEDLAGGGHEVQGGLLFHEAGDGPERRGVGRDADGCPAAGPVASPDGLGGHAADHDAQLLGPGDPQIDGLIRVGLADGDDPVGEATGQPLDRQEDASPQRRHSVVYREGVDGVHHHGDSPAAGGQPAEDAGLGGVGVHHVVPSGQAPERDRGAQVTEPAELPAEAGDDDQPVGGVAGPPLQGAVAGGQVDLVAGAVQPGHRQQRVVGGAAGAEVGDHMQHPYPPGWVAAGGPPVDPGGRCGLAHPITCPLARRRWRPISQLASAVKPSTSWTCGR